MLKPKGGGEYDSSRRQRLELQIVQADVVAAADAPHGLAGARGLAVGAQVHHAVAVMQRDGNRTPVGDGHSCGKRICGVERAPRGLREVPRSRADSCDDF